MKLTKIRYYIPVPILNELRWDLDDFRYPVVNMLLNLNNIRFNNE